MGDLNILFRDRIGFPKNEMITFETLNSVLTRTAKTIPFENFCIIANNTSEINEENLVNKILIKNEGGLCYELNPLLYLFLKANGFHVSLARGAVYDHSNQQWANTGRSHVTILASHEDQTYLIDTGFGGNIPLKPVPLNGEAVTSANGEFRVKKENTEYGDYIFKLKLKDKDIDWKIGYSFDSTTRIDDVSVLNEVQNIITRHPESSFNKVPLITRLTDRGSVTLTNNSLTEWIDGKVYKKEITKTQFKDFVKKHFTIDIESLQNKNDTH